MRTERTQLLTVLSEVLDCVEKELIGVTDHHAKRVAMCCIRMAECANMPTEDFSALAVGALLHDNALSEYREQYQGCMGNVEVLIGHCRVGEENLRYIPGDVSRDFVLYHHEHADGSGPFALTADKTPLGAQLIHIADQLDRHMPLGSATSADLPAMRAFIAENCGTLFAAQVCEYMNAVLTEDLLNELSDDTIALSRLQIPDAVCETDLRALSGLFARVIDYKSPFTRTHSVGVAEKAEAMARYYQWEDTEAEQIYCAGALHDVGKLLVERDVLEKPGKLDQREYQHIQSHAYETYRLLSSLRGMEDITRWASLHHEKLNGKGYPFGLAASELDQKCRLLACLDIYQALTEDRPYKAGMPHSKAISILREMAEKGELDSAITEDIDRAFHTGGAEEAAPATALFQCKVCGHIYEGDTMPDHYECPVCGQPETSFLRLR